MYKVQDLERNEELAVGNGNQYWNQRSRIQESAPLPLEKCFKFNHVHLKIHHQFMQMKKDPSDIARFITEIKSPICWFRLYSDKTHNQHNSPGEESTLLHWAIANLQSDQRVRMTELQRSLSEVRLTAGVWHHSLPPRASEMAQVPYDKNKTNL